MTNHPNPNIIYIERLLWYKDKVENKLDEVHILFHKISWIKKKLFLKYFKRSKICIVTRKYNPKELRIAWCKIMWTIKKKLGTISVP